ncbi:MAG TPA: outer membrane protein transport protein [Verrucomicrobiae bacterium]
MKTNQHSKIVPNTIVKMIAVMTALIVSSEAVWANAFRFPNQDPEAIARGDAFTATADDPAAIYYNPAGITQLPGIQTSAGVYIASEDTHYTSTSGSPVAGTARTDTSLQPVPQFYLTYSPTNLPLSFGLGVYAPFGLSINYGNNAPFNGAAEQGSLLYATINPVVAWKVSKTLSVAIGPAISFSQLNAQLALPTPPFPPGYRFNYNGEGWDAGYTAGLLWQPAPQWSFGIDYHSSTEVGYRGKTEQNTGFPGLPSSVPANVTIPFPENVTGGISFRPTPNWNFEFDLDWTKWSEVRSATFSASPLPGPAPTLTLNLQNSFIYEFGVTRQLCHGYYASVGYEYAENSVPDQSFNPLIPDSDLSLGGIGVGHHGQHWDWAAAFQFAYGARTVSGDTTYPTANGHYSTFNKGLNVSVDYKF